MKNDLMKEELENRLQRFCSIMDKNHIGWDTAVILSRVNQYYFTGTMQDGMLIIKNNRKAYCFVRRSIERAMAESPLAIYPMESYRDAVSVIGSEFGDTYLETEIITVSILERLKKYFHMRKTHAMDLDIFKVRSVKSPFELENIEYAGKMHSDFMRNVIPTLLIEGMSEAEFAAELYGKQIKHGHNGVTRFSMFQIEIGVGQMGFGESSLYPTSFDGPGGAYGMNPAVPLFGSRERKLKQGDLVYVDICYCINGYHTDKTQVYLFGGKPTAEMIAAQSGCIEIERHTAELLKPGAVPAEIYRTVMSSLSDEFKQNFMGYKNRQAAFLGHGIGLHVNEPPIITDGVVAPLEENMVIAVEPKKGIPNRGLVGVEDTYIVTPEGGKCITGGGCDIIEV